MDHKNDFYSDQKFCDQCEDYVTYLQSIEHSYCTRCGGQVRLFSETDWASFHAAMKERRPKGGRPRKDANRKDVG